MKSKILGSLLIATLFSGASLAAPPDLNLLVKHHMTELGADGVTRTVSFAERVYRRDGMVWIERVLPPEAHREADHAKGGHDHKHMDIAAAARWITKEGEQPVRIRLVNAHDKVVVNVPAAEYGNIGFDGKWTSASQLLDPEQLKRMKPAKRAAPAGTRWFEGGTRDTQVQVLWDESAAYPRRIESANTRGTQRSTMVVTRETMPGQMPWAGLKGYTQKEYADLLD